MLHQARISEQLESEGYSMWRLPVALMRCDAVSNNNTMYFWCLPYSSVKECVWKATNVPTCTCCKLKITFKVKLGRRKPSSQSTTLCSLFSVWKETILTDQAGESYHSVLMNKQRNRFDVGLCLIWNLCKCICRHSTSSIILLCVFYICYTV